MSSGLAVEYEDVFAGRPAQLETRARRLQSTADAIERAADALRDLVDDQVSKSTEQVGESAEEAAKGLRRAFRRYSGTASALTTFAVELAPIQERARAAVGDADFHQDRVYSRERDLGDLNNKITQAEAAGKPTDDLRDDLWAANNEIATSHRHVEDARRVLRDAREQIWDAADRAIREIETAIEHGADSFGDNWDQFWGGVGDVLSSVGEWLSDVLTPVIDWLVQVVSELVSELVVLLMMVVGALVVGLVFTLFGPIGLLVLGLGLAAGIIALVWGEQAGSPQLKNSKTESTRDVNDPKRNGELDGQEARDYQDLMQQLAQQDDHGKDSLTEIKVVAIKDADGNIISWRIQTPSTQNWGPFNTDGAMNDLRTDLMLSLFPEMRTQYEEAVWQAMTDAGVFESDAPIMFTGWSLGGMMAGEMATDPRVADRVESVFVAGSAIDKHYSDMPDGVRVTQIKNGIDPVHTLEFVGLDPIDRLAEFDSDWQEYRPLQWPMHDATMYGDQAEHYLPEPRPGDEIFFAETGDGSYEEAYVAQYTRGS